MTRRQLAGCALLAALGSGCGKTDDHPAGTTGMPSAGSGGAKGVGGSSSTPQGGMAETACAVEGPSPGPAPMAALSRFELNRSVRALLGVDLQPRVWLEEAADQSPFSSAAPAPLEYQLHELAHDVALQLSRDAKAVQTISGCDPATSGNATCATSFIEAFVQRAYRRPLTAEDRSDMSAVFAEGERLGGDFVGGVRAVVEVALQSPDFAYLIEEGNGQVTNDAVALTGYESAARLAFFVTGAPPDEQLRATSAQGAMSRDALEAEARRLLGSAASRERLRRYYSNLLYLGRGLPPSEIGPELEALTLEETGRFVEDVTFDGTGTLRALLTEPSAWVNQQLAQFYGVPGITGSEFRKVELDPTQRGGLFTRAAFLHVMSHSTAGSPVQRGLAVLEKLLCYEMPEPPADVLLPAPVVSSPNATMRERVTVATQDVSCMECHRDLNPPGFAFEHYDGVGRWRDQDSGFAIDTSGELYQSDARGKFKDAIELMQRIAESDDAKSCFVRRWQAEAYRRAPEPGDACATAQVAQAFADSDGNLVELMVALATSDNFRYRLKSELAP